MKKLRVHCVTWNVADDPSSGEDFSLLLGVNCTPMPDVICIALQEVVNDSTWTTDFQNLLSNHDYVMIKSRNCWAIWIYTFVLRQHLPCINNIESEVTASGYAGVMGNKGGVSIRMDIYGINFCAMSAHFTPHMENTKERLNDYVDIVTNQQFRDPDVEVVLDHDYMIWMGDLNFRVEDIPREEIEKRIKDGELESLQNHDQLTRARKEGLIFTDFEEGPIAFNPTFKFDKGTSVYDTSKKQRCPSYTDRILYLVHKDCPIEGSGSMSATRRQALNMKLLEYTSLEEYLTSDHRPVVAKLEMTVLDRGPPLPIFFYSPIGDISDMGATASGASWTIHEDGEFKICLHRNRDTHKFRPDMRDWIGLYPAGCMDASTQYITYIYVPTSAEEKLERGVDCKIDKKYLTELAGQEVQLIYFGKKKNCPQGYSRPFKITAEESPSLQGMLLASKTGVMNMTRILHQGTDDESGNQDMSNNQV